MFAHGRLQLLAFVAKFHQFLRDLWGRAVRPAVVAHRNYKARTLAAKGTVAKLGDARDYLR